MKITNLEITDIGGKLSGYFYVDNYRVTLTDELCQDALANLSVTIRKAIVLQQAALTAAVDAQP